MYRLLVDPFVCSYGSLCFGSRGFSFGAVVGDVKSRWCLNFSAALCYLSDPSYMNLLFAPAPFLCFLFLLCTFRYCSNVQFDVCVYISVCTVRERVVIIFIY